MYGAGHGRLVVYFHGAPGAPAECEAFHAPAIRHGLRVACIDRFAADASLQGEAYYEALAAQVRRAAAGQPVDVVGFSIGAFVAMQVCLRLGRQVGQLHLISAAAPLEAGPFLDAMAGGTVFRLARRAPAVFKLLTRWQGWLAPRTLLRMLFASAEGQDRALARDPAFQALLIDVLRACFTAGMPGYVRDVRAYVRPWAGTLEALAVPTHLWHGSQDNWSPPAMAQWLAGALPGHAGSRMFGGLSHYSCLYQAAPEVCGALASPSR